VPRQRLVIQPILSPERVVRKSARSPPPHQSGAVHGLGPLRDPEQHPPHHRELAELQP